MKLLKLILEYKESTIRELVTKFKNETDKDENTIRKYINYFDKIKDNAPEKDIFKYSFQDLYDYVNMQLDIEEEKLENDAMPVEYEKQLFNKNKVEVYLSQSHNACVKHSKGYSYCIGNRNPFYFHKHSKDKTIYFIFDRKRNTEDPNHVNVVQLLKEGNFEVTDALNQGGVGEFLTFEQLAERYPELKGHENIFQYVEREPVADYIEEPNLLEYFKSLNKTKNYIATHSLTAEQFNLLPKKLQDDYVNSGQPVLLVLLNEKQLKRYLFLLLRDYDEFFDKKEHVGGFYSIKLKKNHYYGNYFYFMQYTHIFSTIECVVYDDNLNNIFLANKLEELDDNLLVIENNKTFIIDNDYIDEYDGVLFYKKDDIFILMLKKDDIIIYTSYEKDFNGVDEINKIKTKNNLRRFHDYFILTNGKEIKLYNNTLDLVKKIILNKEYIWFVDHGEIISYEEITKNIKKDFLLKNRYSDEEYNRFKDFISVKYRLRINENFKLGIESFYLYEFRNRLDLKYEPTLDDIGVSYKIIDYSQYIDDTPKIKNINKTDDYDKKYQNYLKYADYDVNESLKLMKLLLDL